MSMSQRPENIKWHTAASDMYPHTKSYMSYNIEDMLYTYRLLYGGGVPLDHIGTGVAIFARGLKPKGFVPLGHIGTGVAISARGL